MKLLLNAPRQSLASSSESFYRRARMLFRVSKVRNKDVASQAMPFGVEASILVVFVDEGRKVQQHVTAFHGGGDDFRSGAVSVVPDNAMMNDRACQMRARRDHRVQARRIERRPR